MFPSLPKRERFRRSERRLPGAGLKCCRKGSRKRNEHEYRKEKGAWAVAGRRRRHARLTGHRRLGLGHHVGRRHRHQRGLRTRRRTGRRLLLSVRRTVQPDGTSYFAQWDGPRRQRPRSQGAQGPDEAHGDDRAEGPLPHQGREQRRGRQTAARRRRPGPSGHSRKRRSGSGSGRGGRRRGQREVRLGRNPGCDRRRGMESRRQEGDRSHRQVRGEAVRHRELGVQPRRRP